jgi:hypothetical protein
METKMAASIRINRSNRPKGKVKIHATVFRGTQGSEQHRVIFLRTKSMKRWMCDCEDFIYRQFVDRKHCVHIKLVKAEIEQIKNLDTKENK